MSTKYWDLYVYYVKKCERENYFNDIDPNHYEMQWNHFWPQCIFRDWPVGQWLTVKQHAIATALQTLAFKRNCLYGGYKSYLQPQLLELAWPYYCEAASVNGVKNGLEQAASLNAEKNENGKSVNAVKGGVAAHLEKDEDGKSVHAVKIGKKGGVKGAAVAHAEKSEDGKSLHAVRGGLACHEKIDENGKSVHAVKCGAAIAAIRSKKVLVTFPDGSQRILKSILETGRFFNVSNMAITYQIKKSSPSKKGKLAGHRFELL